MTVQADGGPGGGELSSARPVRLVGGQGGRPGRRRGVRRSERAAVRGGRRRYRRGGSSSSGSAAPGSTSPGVPERARGPRAWPSSCSRPRRELDRRRHRAPTRSSGRTTWPLRSNRASTWCSPRPSQAWSPAEAAAEHARRCSARLCRQRGSRRGAGDQRVLRPADPLVVNEHEAADLLREHEVEADVAAGELAPALHEGLGLALGGRAPRRRGGLRRRGREPRAGCLTRPSRAVDTTGAGDVLVGVLAADWPRAGASSQPPRTLLDRSPGGHDRGCAGVPRSALPDGTFGARRSARCGETYDHRVLRAEPTTPIWVRGPSPPLDPQSPSAEHRVEALPDPVGAEQLVQLGEDLRRVVAGDDPGASGDARRPPARRRPLPRRRCALAWRKDSCEQQPTRGSSPGAAPRRPCRRGRPGVRRRHRAAGQRGRRRTPRTAWRRRCAGPPSRCGSFPPAGAITSGTMPAAETAAARPSTPAEVAVRVDDDADHPAVGRPGLAELGQRRARARGRPAARSPPAPAGRGPRRPARTGRGRCWPAPAAGAP